MLRGEIKLSSAKELATERIREMINSGLLAPGDRMGIEELARELGISRTPIREAFWALSAEGLVTITPRVGVFVREIDWQEIFDVYDIKSQLEPLMARWAIERSTEHERQEFASSFELLEHAYREGLEPYVECVVVRRESLLSMARSPVLVDALSVIDGRVQLLRRRNLSRPDSMKASLQQHRAIAEAVAEADADAGYARMQEHMIDAGRRIRELLS
jgi:DNA-binding GntR family transcriptional regulator